MAAVGQLDSYFTNLISNLMVLERQPLYRLSEQKENLTTQKAVYSDLQTQFTALQDALNALRSSQASYNVKAGRKVAVTPQANSTVVTASVGTTALAGNYNLSVTTLAKAHTARSNQVSNTDQDLGKTGKILLGGAAARSQVRQDATVDTVSGFDVSNDVASGQKELGSGSYYVETRYDTTSSKWQFRLVDAEGAAVSIRQGASTSTTFGTGWQEFSADQAYETGRGLKITFAAAGSFQARDWQSGAAKTSYTAKGVEFEVKADMSLNEIAAEISALKYADGNEITASVVDRRLVFQSAKTGAARTMAAVDVGADRFLRDLQMVNEANNGFVTQTLGQDSVFTINNVEVTRSSNSGLSDVLSGVILNLAGDAEGKTASISVTSDITNARTALNVFIAKFNDFQNYVKAKTAITKGADGKYIRAALAGDSNLKSLSSDLYSRFTASVANSGIYTNLRQIGIDLDSDLKAKVTDATKLDDALLNRLPDVQKLLDAVMDGMNSKVSRFSGDKGYAAMAKKGTEDQLEAMDERITALNETLAKKEERYTQQYAEIQAQLMQMTYMQQQWSNIYSYSSKLY